MVSSLTNRRLHMHGVAAAVAGLALWLGATPATAAHQYTLDGAAAGESTALAAGHICTGAAEDKVLACFSSEARLAEVGAAALRNAAPWSTSATPT